MQAGHQTLQVPRRANAGLNFYVSIAILVGPTQLAILEAVFPGIDHAPTLVIAVAIASMFAAPLLTQFSFRSRSTSFVNGFILRALLTAALALLVAVAMVTRLWEWLFFVSYLVLFFLLGLAHRIFFNVGWLHLMGFVTPKSRANAFVADVRRMNGLTTSFLSAGTLVILSLFGGKGFLLYIWGCAIAYGFWSFWVLARSIRSDSTLAVALDESFSREAQRYPLLDLLKEFRNARTWRWLWPAFFPTFLVPPVLFLYAVKILGLNWQDVLIVLIVAQLAASLLLPRFVALFKSVTIERLRMLIFALAVLNLILLSGNRIFSPHEVLALGGIAVNSILSAFIGQTLGIVVHNEVIRIGVSPSESPRTFVIYNFALDVVPSIWMFIGSLVISVSSPHAAISPYEALCITGLSAAGFGLIITAFNKGRRLENG